MRGLNLYSEHYAINLQTKHYSILLVLGATLLYSLVPLTLYRGNADQSPLLFIALLLVSSAVTVLILSPRECRSALLNKARCFSIVQSMPKWMLGLGMLGSIPYLFFALAMKYVDVSVVTVIFEVKALFFYLWFYVSGRSDRPYGGFYPTFFGQYLPMMLVAFGMGYLTYDLPELYAIHVGLPDRLIDDESTFFADWTRSGGPLLAYAGGLLGAILLIYTTLMDRRAENWTERTVMNGDSSLKENNCFRVISSVVPGLVTVPPLLALALILGQSISISGALHAIGAGFLLGLFEVLWGKAKRTAFEEPASSQDRDVLSLYYFAPAFSLLWLGMLGYINVDRWDSLIIGSAAVVAGNHIIGFLGDRLFSYRTFVVALWGYGLFAYLWKEAIISDYYSAVFIGATMFVLLLSFLINRIARQIRYEKSQFFKLSDALGDVPETSYRQSIQEMLDDIDGPKSSLNLDEACRKLQRYLTPTNEGSETTLPCQIRAKARIWMHSRQQEGDITEMIALIMLGTVTVFGLLLFLPASVNESAWGGFFAELTAVVIAATVTFLFINVWDLQRARNFPATYQEQGRVAHFISILLCFGIVGTHAWLFYCKWLGFDGCGIAQPCAGVGLTLFEFRASSVDWIGLD